MFTVRMHAMRVLRRRLDRIVDAVEPGGGGDMFAGLEPGEREALLEVTQMGFPPRSWFGHRTMGMHAFPVLYRGVRMADPTYFEDFWTEPGYLGHEAPPSLLRDVLEHRCKVVATISDGEAADLGLSLETQPGQARGGVDTAWRGAEGSPAVAVAVAVRLTNAPAVEVQGAELIVESGAAEGAQLLVIRIVDDVAIFGPGDAGVAAQLRPGDTVVVDNRGFLAAQTYHRHQMPGRDYAVWDQFRDADGSATYPQRPLLLGPLFAAAAAGTVQTGRFAGKMILVESLLDREALPWQADWYRSKVEEHLGGATDDRFRLWFTDNALHGDSEVQESAIHTISYLGVLHQALRDLSAWVEHGISPPPSTNYEVVDGQVVVPAEATARRGVQPVVSLTADGAERADVAIGDDVTFRAVAQAPAGTGQIMAVEWDFDGAGRFAVTERIRPAERAVVERRHSFTTPGTYFPAVRVAAHRDGDMTTPYARIQNLARVRVVVSRCSSEVRSQPRDCSENDVIDTRK